MDTQEKQDNFTNDDIFHYLRKFKDEVARDNKQLEKKVDNIENKINEKLEKMRRGIEENKREGGSMLEEINKRISLIEKEVFKNKDEKMKKKNEERVTAAKAAEREEKKKRRQEEEKEERIVNKEKSLQEELKEASENEDRSGTEDTIEKEFRD